MKPIKLIIIKKDNMFELYTDTIKPIQVEILDREKSHDGGIEQFQSYMAGLKAARSMKRIY